MRPEKQDPDSVKLSPNPLTRGLWFLLGAVFAGSGLLGVVIPGLPTTPFMLLAAACFARSSERFYNWLITNPLFGEQVRRYRAGHGLRPRVKLLASTLASLFMSYAAVYGLSEEHVALRIAVAAVGLFGVWFILSRPTDQGENSDRVKTN